MPKTTSKKYTYAVGRRKSSVATIKLYSGKGNFVVNTLPIDKYFPGENSKLKYNQPFELTDTVSKHDLEAKISGGGKEGQLEALVLAISRALKIINESANKLPLRNAGLLTVDSRVRQRRQVGTGGKARRQKQSPKR